LANLAKKFHKLGGIKDIIENDIKNKFEKSEKEKGKNSQDKGDKGEQYNRERNQT
jgi:hypothetical protein